MKQNFSKSWISSKQPRKQRKYRANAPLHIRSKMLSSNLSKELRTRHGFRSIRIRKGDQVLVKRGSERKKTGIITHIDSQKLKIYIDSIKGKKANQQEIQIPIDPSNVMIIRLNIDDKKRFKIKREKTRVEKIK